MARESTPLSGGGLRRAGERAVARIDGPLSFGAKAQPVTLGLVSKDGAETRTDMISDAHGRAARPLLRRPALFAAVRRTTARDG